MHISTLIKNKTPLLWIQKEDTVGTALNIIRENNITSLPVYDQQGKQFIGIIDVWCLMFFLAFAQYRKEIGYSFVFDEGVNYAETKVAIILAGLTEHSPVVTLCSDNTSMESVIEMILAKGVKRMIVKCDSNLHYLTETDIIRWMYSTGHPHVEAALQKSIGELQMLNHHDVISIKSTESTLEGYKKCFKKNVTALAVVDETSGKLIGNLSASDLKFLSLENFRDVEKRVTSFLLDTHRPSLKPLTCNKSSTLRQVVEKILAANIHQIWVVNESEKPICQISLTDILAVMSNPYHATLSS